MTTKRTIIGTILLILVLGAGWFFLRGSTAPGQRSFFDNLPLIGGRAPIATPAPPPAGLGEEAGGGKTTPEVRRLIQIVAKDIFAPTLAPGGETLFYVARENGHIMASDLDGANERSVINLTVLEAFDASWAPKKNRIAMFYHESGVVKKFLNGVATGTTSRFLPAETQALDWSPDGLSLAYLLRRDQDTALLIADAGNQNPRVLYTTPIPDFTLRWLAKNTILLVSRPSGLAPSIVMSVDVKTRSAELLISGIPGVIVLPAPDGSGFLFSQSTSDGRASSLALYTFRDRRTVPLNLVTLAEKCVFSPDSKKLFCGLPRGELVAPMPDEWYRGATSFSDTLVEIDLATRESRPLTEAAGLNADVVWPFVSPGGTYLFFQNRKDGTLWRLQLE